MADEYCCITCRIRAAIRQHYPNGITVDDAAEAIGALAEVAGEALAGGTDDHVQQFVDLVHQERRNCRAEARQRAH